jgi:uncharacterized repeat protein (TIGR04052 family)
MRTRTLMIAALAWGCGDSGSGSGGSGGSGGGGGTAGSSAGGAAPTSVEIEFEARVGGEPFSCTGQFDAVGLGDSPIEFLDFRLYVHDVRVVSGGEELPVALDQDGLWQYEDVALLDFEDQSGSCSNGTSPTNATIRGSIPAGIEPERLRFRVGVPEALNHGDSATAPSPLNLSGMFWDWLTGYKFVRIDARPVGSNDAFLMHLASTVCSDEGGSPSCARRNSAEFDLAFPSNGAVVIDYAALAADVDLSADEGGAPGCMSGADDPECVAIFPAYGVDIATGEPSGSPSWMIVE